MGETTRTRNETPTGTSGVRRRATTQIIIPLGRARIQTIIAVSQLESSMLPMDSLVVAELIAMKNANSLVPHNTLTQHHFLVGRERTY